MNKHKTDPIYIDLYIEKKMKEMKQNFSTDERTPCREEWKTNWNLVTSDSLGCVFKEDSFGILLTGACTYFVSLVLPLALYFFLIFFSILFRGMWEYGFLFFLVLFVFSSEVCESMVSNSFLSNADRNECEECLWLSGFFRVYIHVHTRIGTHPHMYKDQIY